MCLSSDTSVWFFFPIVLSFFVRRRGGSLTEYSLVCLEGGSPGILVFARFDYRTIESHLGFCPPPIPQYQKKKKNREFKQRGAMTCFSIYKITLKAVLRGLFRGSIDYFMWSKKDSGYFDEPNPSKASLLMTSLLNLLKLLMYPKLIFSIFEAS